MEGARSTANAASRPLAVGESAQPAPRGEPTTRAARVDRVARIAVWIAYALIVTLSLRAPLLRTGDAQQYVAMADAFAHLRPPSFPRPKSPPSSHGS